MLSLGCNQPGGPVEYEVIRGNGPEPALTGGYPRRIFDHDLGRMLLNDGSPARAPVTGFPPELQIYWPSALEACQIVPLSVFAVPIGFLLIPDRVDLPVLEWQGRINDFLTEAMFSELNAYFSESLLLGIPDSRVLWARFNESILPWLAPCTHNLLYNDEVGLPEQYFAVWESGTAKRVAFREGERLFYVEYTFPDKALEISPLKQTLWRLQLYFEHALFTRWKRLHASIPDRGTLETKLNQIADLLEGLRQDVAKIAYAPITSSSGHNPEPTAPFSFFLPKGRNDWLICFNGERVELTETKRRDMGFEAIRILLQHPNRPFTALELYAKNRFGRGQRDAPETNVQENERRKSELISRLKFLEEELDDSLPLWELSQIYRFLRDILSILIEHEPVNTYYKRKYNEYLNHYNALREKLKEAEITRDNNFSLLQGREFTELKPTGSRNTVRTLQLGIEDAIKLLNNSALKAYLTETIVSSRRQGHEPFEYVPGLSRIPEPNWDTGDPIT